MFRILDSNKDGLVTIDDWRSIIYFDHSNPRFVQLLAHIKKQRLTAGRLLGVLGLEGVRRVSVFTLKNGLLKLWSELNEEEALLLARFVGKGKEEVEVERVLDALNVREDEKVEADREWEERFFGRLKRRLNEHNITEEELASKLGLHDKSGGGFVEQADFKTVLGEVGLSLTLNELIKLVRFVPLNGQNHLKYQYVVERLREAEPEGREELGEEEFKKVMREVLAQPKLPFALPIGVSKLAALLQSRFFKRCP